MLDSEEIIEKNFGDIYDILKELLDEFLGERHEISKGFQMNFRWKIGGRKRDNR